MNRFRYPQFDSRETTGGNRDIQLGRGYRHKKGLRQGKNTPVSIHWLLNVIVGGGEERQG